MSAAINLSHRRLQKGSKGSKSSDTYTGGFNHTYSLSTNNAANITEYISTNGPKGSKGSKGGKSALKSSSISLDSSSLNSVLFYASICIISMVIILFIIKWIRRDKQLLTQSKNKVGKTFLIMFIAMTLCFFSGDIIILLGDGAEGMYILTQSFIYRFSRGMMSIFFLLRLKLCFTGSVLEISNKRFGAILCVIILSFLIWLIGFALILSADGDKKAERREMTQLSKDFEIISWAIDCIVNIVILWLFLRGIWKTALPSTMDISTMTSNNKLELDNHQLNFMKFIIKNSNLAIWGLISSMFPQIYGLLVSAQIVSNDVKYYSALAMDGAVNIVCMYLIFKFCEREYGIICRCCDKCLGKCCIYFAMRKLNNIAAQKESELAVYVTKNAELELEGERSNGIPSTSSGMNSTETTSGSRETDMHEPESGDEEIP